MGILMRAPFGQSARVRLAFTLLVLLGLAFSAAPAVRADGKSGPKPLVVIVSARSKLRDVSHALLRRIFLGEPTEYDGLRWVPFNYEPDDPLRIRFDSRAFGLSQEAAGRYWVDRRIRGQGLPPRSIATQSLLRAVVARLPGAIGYITADQLNGTVRALTIDGVAWDKEGYLLR